ncbi:Ku protein [Acidisphaera sp. L21]|uniref:non-homologous end joining protein Ku n=1 Tax=Acidisphaera sp. L21 TaxID=1641851 RepID=UPI00131E8D52|nr:Ku protein [Acidisphaera sp. L21]
MPQRPIWRGHLRLALVSCPIALYSANHDRGSLHFNLINPKTGNRIKMITQDAETGDTLSRGDLVKGYEFKKDHYLIVDDEDFESARIESSTTVKIEKFVDTNSIDPIYFDASYYVAPDGDAGQDVYLVLRDAIASTGKIALSRVVIARREHPIAIMPMGKGLVVHTLHEERDLNDYGAIFDHLPSTKPDPDMIQLATQLIDRQTGKYAPADIEDRYETRLRAVIDAKLKGEGIEAETTEEPDRSNVVDLMAALRKSLGQTEDKAEAPKKGSASKAAAKPKPAPKAKEEAPALKKPSAPAKGTARKRA